MSTPESLERRIDELRVATRQAVASGDRAQARELRAALREAERAWDSAVADMEQAGGAQEHKAPGTGTVSLVPVRERVHHALTLLDAPAAPRLILAVDAAFGPGPLPSARLTSLRRDEERSFRAAPHSRPYYLCSALTADMLAPARGLLAISSWALARRVIGPLSLRVNFLSSAVAVAGAVRRLSGPNPQALRLLWQFAVNIPGAGPSADGTGTSDPDAVEAAAHAELVVHKDRDEADRSAAAERARAQLDDAGQLFGSRLRLAAGRTS